MALEHVIPDLDALLTVCLDGALLRDSQTHGEQHWRAVAHVGIEIGRVDPEPDLELVLLFAMLHDARREGEFRDPEHGPRAAELASEVREAGLIVLDDARLRLLVEACELHDTGAVSADPTVGACYDADRVNLTRLGFVIDPKLISRPAARDTQFIDWCRLHASTSATWDELAAMVAQRA